MGRLMTAKQLAAATALLPGGAVLAWPGTMWLNAIFLVWIAAVAAFWIREERKEHQERLTRTIAAMQSSGIRTLNHHRHDWMNDLQVLFGYMRLGKLDKTIAYVERIRERMLAESAVAKLGVPSLVSFIQSFRTMSSSLQLDVEVQEELHLNELDLDSEAVAETLIHTINTYRLAAKAEAGGASVLRLVLSRDGEALYAAFYYEGELINEQHWNQNLKQQLDGAPLRLEGTEPNGSMVLLKAEMRV
ncbi:Spo0B domain-containing protein [Paenibacillus sp. PL2-23]|uniref:Spo0B domain-containing protein n=1 Tax=Paenibacillus sp. PL2-23 TaxID=2100729 RepID=UPI0030F7A2D3